MPSYEFKCLDCEELNSRYIPLDFYNEMQSKQYCEKCNSKKPMQRYFANQTMRFIGPLIEFHDIGQDRIITSRRQIRQIEKDEGKILGGHQELRQEAAKNKANIKLARKRESRKRSEKVAGELYKKWNGY